MKDSIAISETWNGEDNELRLEALLKKYDQHLQEVIRRNEKVASKTVPKFMNQKEVIVHLGLKKAFEILVDEYGLKPIREEHKCNIYSVKQDDELSSQFAHNY